jgi:hypothetical protein
MACEKQKGSITALALGELHAKRELELLAHTGDCDACREAYEHAARVRDSVERGVESLVTGEPSPHFATRLRARIAAEPAPTRSYWSTWAPVAATLALVALMAALTLRTHRHSITPDVATLPPAVAPIAPSYPTNANSLTPMARIARPRGGGAIASASSQRLSSHAPELPEVIVPPGQLAAALELTDAFSDKRVDGQQLVALANKALEPLKINDLEVPPLEQLAPLADSSEDPGSF